DIFRRADTVLVQLEGFVGEARGPLTQAVRNVETFTEALSRNSEGIDLFLANFGKLSESLGTVSGQLETTLKAAEGILNAVDNEKVANVVANVESFTATLEKSSDELTRILGGVEEAVTQITAFS